MSHAAEARKHILDIAGAMPAGSRIKEMLGIVSRRTGFGHRRIRALWNGEARIISSAEMDVLRAAAQRREQREANDRADYHDLLGQLALLVERAGMARPPADRSGTTPGGSRRVGGSMAQVDGWGDAFGGATRSPGEGR